MSERKVRVRFAPSPTGPLHMGGVRTALYNYLFAKKHGGDFILRIEDTDQERFVPGAEDYIIESLKWCGIEPNEGVGFGDGEYTPYRQSDRKNAGVYAQYADQLVKNGYAYYAFDTSEELDEMRKRLEAAKAAHTSYNAITRQHMKNSLTLPEDEVKRRIDNGDPYVIRINIPRNEEVRVNDIIRGWVVVNTTQMDDKVLFKSDGMPTYHLANVVDDYSMKITHVIRGEEWLPSAPLHVLLYKYLGWEQEMPQFAHLPLLLKPDGNGKLSKRDGDRLGFPVFPLEWKDPKSGEVSSGYREKGYFADGFINMLALLGWHASGNQELFTMDELIQEFSLERVSKAGAKFDPEKTKWFNQQYLRQRSDEELARVIYLEDFNSSKYFNILGKTKLFPTYVLEGDFSNVQAQEIFENKHKADFNYLVNVCRLMKEKAVFIQDIIQEGAYFFNDPESYDEGVVKKRWNEDAKKLFDAVKNAYQSLSNFTTEETEKCFKDTATMLGLNPGQFMQMFRVAVSGAAGGPVLFEMVELLGKEKVVRRLENVIQKLG